MFPIKGGALDGLDALLSISQMPPGVPVACVGLDNATNAAVLAVPDHGRPPTPSCARRCRTFKDSFEQDATARLAGKS